MTALSDRELLALAIEQASIGLDEGGVAINHPETRYEDIGEESGIAGPPSAA